MAELIYQRPKLYKLQSEAFFNDSRYAWIEGSTKSGKTVSCMAWIVEQAVFLGKEGREFWWVAPVSSVASIAFKRLKRGIPSYFVRSIISSPGKESITCPSSNDLRLFGLWKSGVSGSVCGLI